MATHSGRSSYEQAVAAVAAGGTEPIDMILRALAEGNLSVVDPQVGYRTSHLCSWVIPFLDEDGTQRLIDSLLEQRAPNEDLSDLWEALEYSAPGVVQKNFSKIQRDSPKTLRDISGVAWRCASDPLILKFLRDQVEEIGRDLEGLDRTVLQTRNVDLIKVLIEHRHGPFPPTDEERHELPNRRPFWDVDGSLAWVGLVQDGGRFIDQTTPRRMHITFPEEFHAPQAFGHPTDRLDAPDVATATFGGCAETNCALCSRPLDRFLQLDSHLEMFGVTSRSQLELAVCYECRDASYEMFDNALWYRHDASGSAHSIPQPDYRERYRRSWEPMATATVTLRESPLDRWIADHNGPPFDKGNYLGGMPINAYFWGAKMECIECDQAMRFLANIAHETYGGSVHFYWCDDCAISGVSGQHSG